MPHPSAADSFPDADWRRRFRRRLLTWFRRQARDLPWRASRDAYRVWVSEIMLQQTQVATVGPYFERFISRFPDVASLAAADEQEVLRLWEGLGYYRRARQMHAAAQVIVQRHDGRFPRDFEAALALPGIGRYTAGAVLSIAYDQRLPILEANSMRVLSRLLAFRGDPQSSAGQQTLWSFAEALLPRREVGLFNQAVMELGSEVCTPKSPDCADCPARDLCPTRAQGVQASIPTQKKKTGYTAVREAAVVVRRRGRVLVRQCGPDERWSGLWDFPRFRVSSARRAKFRRELVDKLVEQTGVEANFGDKLTTIKHGVTRFRITLDCFEATYLTGDAKKSSSGPVKWVRPKELGEMPLSVTGRKIAELIDGKD